MTVLNGSYTSTAAASTAGVSSQTRRVRVLTTTDAYVKIGTAAIATTNDTYLTGLSAEYFTITPSEKVSAISANSTSGAVNVTEISG